LASIHTISWVSMGISTSFTITPPTTNATSQELTVGLAPAPQSSYRLHRPGCKLKEGAWTTQRGFFSFIETIVEPAGSSSFITGNGDTVSIVQQARDRSRPKFTSCFIVSLMLCPSCFLSLKRSNCGQEVGRCRGLGELEPIGAALCHVGIRPMTGCRATAEFRDGARMG
jgi:hypothetical protein